MLPSTSRKAEVALSVAYKGNGLLAVDVALEEVAFFNQKLTFHLLLFLSH